MHTHLSRVRHRFSALAAAATVIASGLVVAVAPTASAAPEPQTYTVTYQCDPALPGYGTNTTGGAPFDVRIGDTVRVVMSGGGCREGSMHTRGDLGMFATTPAWTMSCCSVIPANTVYTMKVVKYSETRYGKGWIALSFYRDNRSTAELVVMRVAAPQLVVPGPIEVTSTLPDEDQAYVYFNVPVDGYSPLTAYEWRITSPKVSSWNSYKASQGSPAWIDGLDAGVKYTVELRAVNSVGAGPATTVSFTTKSQPPGPPLIDSVDPEDGALILSFTPGTTGGSPIRGYRYRLDGGEWQGAGTDASPVRIDGLENGRTYQIELRSFNATEAGIPSGPVNAEPNDGAVDLRVCHWDGDGYEAVFVTGRPRAGAGDHGGHGRDIVPAYAFLPDGSNWDDNGFWTWESGCVSDDQPDADGDGDTDLEDADDDNDGIPDAIDEDDDGDGTNDRYDADHEFSVDSDGDGVPNAGESDDDGDGIADVVDEDGDGDGILDVEDKDRPLPGDVDNDGVADALDADDDGDCLVDSSDADHDGDGIADAIDPDLDNDGLLNDSDLDANGDGLADIGDSEAEFLDAEDASTRASCDKDGAGETGASGEPLRIAVDTDGDGVPNRRDKDDDGDGVSDALDRDSDGDGVRDAQDGDANGDGTPETKDQPLTTSFQLPPLTAKEGTIIVQQPLRTVAGQRATVDVRCTPSKSPRMRPSGDIGAVSPSGRCRVVNEGGSLRLFVPGGKSTTVTVRISAPAVDDYRALAQVVTANVS